MTDSGYIRVCDDNGTRAENWATDIELALKGESELKAVALRVEEFAEAFEDLKARQRHARKGTQESPGPALAKLDEAQIVISDFDLTPADGSADLDEETLKTLSGSFGDVFAYLVRNFTDAAYVVLANQAFFQSTFDLSHMRFATSNADLNVAGEDLRRTSLWTGASDGTTYRPWHWPRLLDVSARRRALAASLDLDAPVLQTLGLADQDTMNQFSSEQIEFLGPEPEQLKFKDVCATVGRFGRSTENEVIPERYLPQASVGIICHWLERVVMPGQNVTIDAPHLAQRRPGVLKSRAPEDWSTLCDLSKPERVQELFIEEFVAGAQLQELAAWTSRPVWAWHRIPRNTPRVQVDEVQVFCEDVSAFHRLEDAWEYESSVPSPFTQRFVLRPDDLDEPDLDVLPTEYWPTNRLFG